MIIQILTEPSFENSSWCKDILEGLLLTLSRKRLNYDMIKEIPDRAITENAHFLIIIASDEKWLTGAISRCRDSKIHPVVLGCQPRRPMPGVFSSVTSDIRQSMHYIINHLSKRGKNLPALYGINPASLPNLARKDSFLEFADGNADEKDIYYNNGSLKDCFEAFWKNHHKYDCVICANDYAAISLIRNLEKKQVSSDSLLIVSYGGTLLSTRFSSELLTVSMRYDEYGKAAVSICETLAKNPALLYLNIAVKWKIGSSDELTVNELPYLPHMPDSVNFMTADELFYSDDEMCHMIQIENMLSSCDKIDLTIVETILDGGSYDDAAEKCFISHNTVKYRLKKLMDICGCQTKKDFVGFVKKYY